MRLRRRRTEAGRLISGLRLHADVVALEQAHIRRHLALASAAWVLGHADLDVFAVCCRRRLDGRLYRAGAPAKTHHVSHVKNPGRRRPTHLEPDRPIRIFVPRMRLRRRLVPKAHPVDIGWQRGRHDRRTPSTLEIETGGGHDVPAPLLELGARDRIEKVETIRILGIVVEKLRVIGEARGNERAR